MPRQSRLEIAGVPQHVIQVGAGDAPIFLCADDCLTYMAYLYEASRHDGCEIHAYALAWARVQLLVTGRTPGAVARMMRRVGLAYARHANARDGRRGARWRGRYHSCPVGGHRHILLACGHVERSAERSPVAPAIGAPHAWSSHACNAHGLDDRLVSQHPAYARLGHDRGQRLHHYRQVVDQSSEIDEALSMHTRQGRAWGSADFLQDVAAVLGVKSPARRPGRPSKAQQPAGIQPARFPVPFSLDSRVIDVENL